MLYENMAATADKWLRSDGSVTTMAGERVLPPDPTRAALYENMTPNVAKWLLPDGSIVNELPVSGRDSGGGVEEIEKRPTMYIATCVTGNSSMKKVLSGLPADYEPLKGDFLIVKFVLHNTATNCMFTFSSDTNAKAYSIKFNGLNTNTTASAWKANSMLPFYYDGTYFHQLCYAKEIDDNTTYDTGIFDQPIGLTKFRINAERDIIGYQLALESANGSFDSACISAIASNGKTKEVNTYSDFKVDGLIWFNFNSKPFPKDTEQAATATCMSQTCQAYIGNYAMNGVKDLQSNSWVYLVGIPQDDPMIYRLDPTGFTSWYTTGKPTTDDGKVYIRLGYFTDGKISLFAEHPAYWFKNGYFRPYLTT